MVLVCFCCLGFLFPNCSTDSQKPSGNYSQFTPNSSMFSQKGVINGLGPFPTMALPHPTTALCPTSRECQSSQGSAVDGHWSLAVFQIQDSGSNSNVPSRILSAMDAQLMPAQGQGTLCTRVQEGVIPSPNPLDPAPQTPLPSWWQP